MLRHLKFSVPDWIFCTLASVGLIINVVQSFLLPEALSVDVLRMALIAAGIIAILVVLSFSRVTSILSVVFAVAAVVIVLVLANYGMVTGFTESEDAEANAGLWYLVVIICILLVYLLSRTRITSWALLIAGMLAAAYLEAMEYTVYLWGALLFMFSVGAWICFIGYRRNVLKFSSMRTAFVPTVVWAAALSLICLLIGSLLWWGVVRPLQPPHRTLNLITELEQFDLLEERGLIDEDNLMTPEELSDVLDESLHELTNEMQALASAQADADGDLEREEAQGTDQNAEGSQTDTHNENPDAENNSPSSPMTELVHWITYDRINLIRIIFLGILLLLILAALVVLFIQRKKIWYRRKTKGMDAETYIRFLFAWSLKRMKKMKLPAPMGDTPLEYANRLESHVRFLEGTGVTWRELSEIFTRISYGGRRAKAEDRERFEQFYKGFYRCCRKKYKLGWIFRGLRM